jgi:hypothetical protein
LAEEQAKPSDEIRVLAPKMALREDGNSSADPIERAARRWKRAFFGIYLAFVFAAVTLTFFSVLAVHCGWRPVPLHGRQISANGHNRAELRECHRDLQKLLSDLHREAFTVQARALRFDTNPAAEWRNWSAAWQLRWRTLDWRCRFRELAGSDRPEIAKMAAIHGALDELHHAYSGQVDRFIETYVQRLRRMSRELADVRAMIDRRPKRQSQAQATPSAASGATEPARGER